MNTILSIILTSLIVSLIIRNKQQNLLNIKKSLLYSSIYTIVIAIIYHLTQKSLSLVYLSIGIIISIFINTLILNNRIDIKKIPKTLIVIMLFFTISLIQLIPMYIFNINESNITPEINIKLTLFSDSILLLILFLLYKKDLKKEFKEFKSNFYQIFENSFKIWLIGLIGMMTTNILIMIFIDKASPNNENTVQSMISIEPLITLLCAGFLAPFIEEIVFRKSFKDILKPKWIFILMSGIVFGLLHVVFSFTSIYDFIYVVPYSALGISFAYMVYKTDNIFSSITMHTIHNTALILMSILTGMIII